MVSILYTFDREFMKKTFEAVDGHVDVPSAYLPLAPEARGCSDELREVNVDDVEAVDENVFDVDPDVVVRNHTFRAGEFRYEDEYPVVHVRHGASYGRDEVETTVSRLKDHIDAALAPGTWWADRYREGFSDDTRVEVVGIPEADRLVNADPPRRRRVLYAPTNHNYGGGSYLDTAEHVLDVFEGTDFHLRFRPHPMDRTEEPGRSVTDRCKERIEEMPNAVFDRNETPTESLLDSDVLLSDYSGIVTEWLHTDRPFVQFTTLAADAEVPKLGYQTRRLDVETVDELYENGLPDDVLRRQESFRDELGIPMDGRAGERVATEVTACTQ
ncbi:CDP-glycerol glycerophosphotransferase family protein [Halopelagius longus]|uniref:CDP-Glycerol:Poly(Glycerophosphate) glycerophosphotransferase n=1 Tax=Halopelagius longus TaxID=1236180 RepID=A0A1H1GGC1_9EURY|nr:CDP-glycerol glycerophosphotransferase family protein [Halopelagius longus]RDI69609.1 hypothetical protein DWB78_17700 [Halopelagius longus]SDR12241.1 CDP-Glycerol:Poly(glycerophosphate) glycerophosphotransferase [Halopelagius longus]